MVHLAAMNPTQTPDPKGRASGLLQVASALFFLSGATGLAYQVVWFKRFSYVWGNSSLAMAAVVASFLCGLGLGAFIVGKLADRTRSPLLWYGLFEATIGVLAVLIPMEIHWLVEFSSWFYSHFEGSPWLHTSVRFLLTFIILGPPCILMGGTLPLLVKQFTPAGSGLEQSTGWLYGINTLGAAAGCYATGFHIAPGVGLFWTNTGVAVSNLAIGASAVWVARHLAPPETAAQKPAPEILSTKKLADEIPRTASSGLPVSPPSTSPPSMLLLYTAAAVTGCGALILEMVWARQLALILGGSTYAFTAMLIIVLVGIGLGSLIFHLGREWFAGNANAPSIVIASLSLTTMAGKWLIPDITNIVGSLGALRTSQAINAAVCVGASAALEFLPAVGMGILFPLLVQLTRKGHREAGRAVGGIYAFNTLGSIIGAAGTSLLLLPLLGTARSIAFGLGLYTIALFLLSPPLRGWRTSTAFFVLCMLAGTGAFMSIHEDDPRETNRGAYIYGAMRQVEAQADVLLFREGPSCNVLVTRYGDGVSLRVNGKVDASNYGDMKMQVGSAYVPMFLAPDAKEVLVIGFGSGTTVGATLLYPGVHVDCCEIEPAVFESSQFFHDVNHRPEESPRFKLVPDDGRSYLQGTDKIYDLIISEPSNPWLAGLSNLYSREYYEIASDRLTSEGILAQWIQTYSFSPRDYALVVRTMLAVFPHASFVRISEGDTILLASKSPITPTRKIADKAQAAVDSIPPVHADLKKYFAMTDVRSIFLTHILLDSEGLRRLIENDGTGVVNTDVNLRLEFDAPLHLFKHAKSSERIYRQIQRAGSAEPFLKLAESLGCKKDQAEAFHKLAFLFDKNSFPELVSKLVDRGLKLDPKQPLLLADRLIISPPDDDSALQAAIADLYAISNREAHRVAIALLDEGKREEARIVLEYMTSVAPESVTAWTDLAQVYQALDRSERAREAISRAIALDPIDERALNISRALVPHPEK